MPSQKMQKNVRPVPAAETPGADEIIDALCKELGAPKPPSEGDPWAVADAHVQRLEPEQYLEGQRFQGQGQ